MATYPIAHYQYELGRILLLGILRPTGWATYRARETRRPALFFLGPPRPTQDPLRLSTDLHYPPIGASPRTCLSGDKYKIL